MIAPEDTALVLLAAGLSRRFGADKLTADFGGRPLGLHAAETLARMPFAVRIAVTGAVSPDYAALGYRCVRNAAPDRGQAGSLHLGIRAARESGTAALLVALADMPLVTAGLVGRLLDAAEGEAALVASCDGARRSPPALFGRAWFERLEGLDGDQGARSLLLGATAVAADPRELVDVDTTAVLAELSSTIGT